MEGGKGGWGDVTPGKGGWRMGGAGRSAVGHGVAYSRLVILQLQAPVPVVKMRRRVRVSLLLRDAAPPLPTKSSGDEMLEVNDRLQ